MNCIFKKNITSEICSEKNRKGFTIIEGLVLLFIFMVIITTFYRFFVSGTNLIMEAKRKMVAVNVANERIELIRSLPYGEIGTVSGVPVGNIDPDESLSYGGYAFRVITSIGYYNDEYDGAVGDPEPNDYKKITIAVSWGSGAANQMVTVSTIAAPFGEEVSIGGGILDVGIVDVEGNPIDGAYIEISNSSLSYSDNAITSSNGTYSFIGLPASNQNYIITISKSGYETDVHTLAPYPTSSFYPTNVHASVVSGSTSNAVFSLSKTSDFKIKFIDPISGESIPGVNFTMEGGRVIGTNTDATLVHNFEEDLLESNSSGEEEVVSASPGQYTLSVNEPGYTLWKTDSGLGNNANELLVSHGEVDQIKTAYLLNENINSYFVKIVDSVSGFPVEDVTVEISNIALGFNDSGQTDGYGNVLFPSDDEVPLMNSQVYEVSISKPGYNSKSGSVTINQLTEDTITINPL